MLLFSWPLWTGGGELPRVPFLRPNVAFPMVAESCLACLLLAGVVGAGLANRWRPWFAVSLGALVGLLAGDQHRFQPWAYQYAMTGLFLAACRGRQGLNLVRWWFVALYAYSALSKFDASFCDELGPVFLRSALGPWGIDPIGWSHGWRTSAVLALPAAEIAVAAALAVPTTRAIGRVGAVVMHLALIALLGPLGLNHSAIVLVWNSVMLVEVWITFGPDAPMTSEPPPLRRREWRSDAALLIFWAGVLLPIGERWELFDAWPSHALYASHVGRLSVAVHESELAAWPVEIRRHVREGDEGLWKALDLTAWSRRVRGTPIYPQNRASLGLAEALAARYRGRLIRVVVLGPADRWTGARRRVQANGLSAIRALGDLYWLNAHPAPGP